MILGALLHWLAHYEGKWWKVALILIVLGILIEGIK